VQDSDDNRVLTDMQIEQFVRDGFVTMDRITTDDEVLHLVELYDDMFNGSGFAVGDKIELADEDAGKALPQIVNPERYVPDVVLGPAFANASRIARQLLGPSSEPMGNHAILKPAWHGAATPWHQDEAYWDTRFLHRAISVWIPLQPVGSENGCMTFVPGSHRGPLHTHELIAPDAHGLRLAIADDVARCESAAVPCPLPAGGATVHGGRTVHYAGPNLTDRPRRALIFAFRAEPVRLETPWSAPWQRAEWFDS
jgi:hypothetical protein